LCKALSFAKKLVTKGSEPKKQIQIEPFLLDSETGKNPVSFCFDILVDNVIYNYSFSVTFKQVVEEKLSVVREKSEEVLFCRIGDKFDVIHNFKSEKAEKINEKLQLVAENTRTNQLFLYNTIDQNMNVFFPVFNWFHKTLKFLHPDERIGQNGEFTAQILMIEKHPFVDVINELLPMYDTGIDSLSQKEYRIDDAPVPDGLKSEITSLFEEDGVMSIQSPDGNLSIVVRGEDGQLKYRTLMAKHKVAGGGSIDFEIKKESDGTKRLLYLIPVYNDLLKKGSDSVYIADELDRSLHPLLVDKLINTYLEGCNAENRSQLIFTTHNMNLMDQKIFRRDEMWVTERAYNGNSFLFSFGEFRKDIRYDKDIRKSYLQGRFGGVPEIHNFF
jgi:AAA15 family ATPase/GTPase